MENTEWIVIETVDDDSARRLIVTTERADAEAIAAELRQRGRNASVAEHHAA